MSKSAVFTVLLGIAAATVPLPRAVVERWYSAGLYGFLQPALTFGSNAVPIALLDLMLGAAAALFAALALIDLIPARKGRWRGLGRLVIRTVVWGARLYLVFLALWGLNYQRERMVDRLPFDAAAVNEAGAARLAAAAVDRLNSLHEAAHAEGWVTGAAIDPALAGAFERVVRDLGSTHRVVAGRPKRSILDWYFQRAGIAGMTDPFFLETIVAGDVLPFERPFVVAHEWSHLAGLADEGEANLAGWFTCLQGTPGHQYSGWLFMYDEALRVVPAADRARLAARLAPGPRQDLRAIRARVTEHVNPRMSAAGWRVYDSYLRANRVAAGGASYDEVVRLALGLRVAPRF